MKMLFRLICVRLYHSWYKLILPDHLPRNHNPYSTMDSFLFYVLLLAFHTLLQTILLLKYSHSYNPVRLPHLFLMFDSMEILIPAFHPALRRVRLTQVQMAFHKSSLLLLLD